MDKGKLGGMFDNNFFDAEHSADGLGAVVGRADFNAVMGGCLFFGFLVNYLECRLLGSFFAGINPVVFLAAYFISCFFGIFLAHASNTFCMSFIGYCFVVLPVGGVVSLVTSDYNIGVIASAFALTACTTFFLCVLGTLYGRWFLQLGSALFVTLMVFVGSELLFLFTGRMTGTTQTAFDVFGAFLFTMYIGYDYARAQKVKPTFVNAVGCALGLYLDIINLFLRFLRLLGRKK